MLELKGTRSFHGTRALTFLKRFSRASAHWPTVEYCDVFLLLLVSCLSRSIPDRSNASNAALIEEVLLGHISPTVEYSDVEELPVRALT